jgi:hypothetical protein
MGGDQIIADWGAANAQGSSAELREIPETFFVSTVDAHGKARIAS